MNPAATFVLALMTLTGCLQLRRHESGRRPPTVAGPPPHVTTEPVELVLGYSVDGTPLVARAFGTGPNTVLVLAAIHGNEPGSHELVDAYAKHLETHPDELDGLRIVLATPVNPDGLAKHRRGNSRGVDLNRNFPASNFEPGPRRGPTPLSEPEARFVARLLELYPPVLTISVHQPRRSVNYDGPALGIAEAMSACNGYRVEASVGYPTPGSLGSWLGKDLERPIITLELPRKPLGRRTFLAENLPALQAAMDRARRMTAAVSLASRG